MSTHAIDEEEVGDLATDPLLLSMPPPPSSQRSEAFYQELNVRHRRHPSHFDLPLHHSHETPSINSGRILDRDADFYQSRGRWSGVELLPAANSRRNRSSLTQHGEYHPSHRHLRRRQKQCCGNCSCYALQRQLKRRLPQLWDDWFHTLAYQRTFLLMTILFVIYFAIVVLFGYIYLGVSLLGAKHSANGDSTVVNSFCDMEISNHMEAFYFSMSTMTTIGYGVSDYYFGGCWTPFLLVLIQVCTAITFDACAVGLLFTRLSRGRKRSKTIIVSNQAVVQVVQGIPYFMVRVGELRRVPLINASVKLFCIRHERIPKIIVGPSFLDTTTTTTSAIIGNQQQSQEQQFTRGSPSSNNTGDATSSISTAKTNKMSNQSKLIQNQNNNNNNNNNTIQVETTHFVTRSMQLIHPDQSTMQAHPLLMSLPQVVVHRIDQSSPLLPPSEWWDAHGQCHVFPQNKDNLLDVQHQMQDFWKDRRMEVVVLVEGTDELTGTAIQTRHSYSTVTTADAGEDGEGDVAWNHAFVNCILPYEQAHIEDDVELAATLRQPGHPICTVDFSLFHDIVPTPRDCFASPYVPS